MYKKLFMYLRSPFDLEDSAICTVVITVMGVEGNDIFATEKMSGGASGFPWPSTITPLHVTH